LKRLFILLLLNGSISVFAQVLQTNVSGITEEVPMVEFLHSLESRQPVRFFFLPEWFDQITVNSTHTNQPLDVVLRNVLQGTDISYITLFNYDVIFFKHPEKEILRQAVIKSATERNIKLEQVVIGSKDNVVRGKKITIHGSLRDEKTENALPGVIINIQGNESASLNSTNGSFTVTLEPGIYAFSFKLVNYEEKIIEVSAFESGDLKVTLNEMPITLQEIEVSDQAITTTRISQTSIKMIDIKRTPSFLGMADILKQIQTLTGVSTVSEASSGFNVRGGSADQNLVLFDGVPIFNTSHALGFFTAFNTEAISRASFYKGGIPAEFGGRVSSVLNITGKEGDYQKWRGTGGIGFVSSDLTIGGPIKRDTTSVIASFRSSYSDWILNLLKSRYGNIQQGSVFFYDGTVKLAHKFSNKSRLYLTSYFSSDRFKLANDTTNQWWNKTLSARYDKTVNDHLFYSVGLYVGSYAYRVTEKDPPTAFALDYGIRYPSIKIDFNDEGHLHKRSFGFHSTYYAFQPGQLKPTSDESNKINNKVPHERAIESAVYFSDAFHLNEKLNLEAGIRLSVFNRMGPGVVYKYKDGEPLEPRNTIDSVSFASGEFMKTYVGPEPRFTMQYMLTSRSSIKMGLNRIYQYVHLVSNTAAITPIDIWQLSNRYFKPQRADQISLGYFRDMKDNKYEGFVEVYYKKLNNVLDFKDGANLILNKQLETTLFNGIGKSYGVEFAINKNKGKLTGGLNYTYSRSLRKFNGAYDVEKINKGNWYPSGFDQPNIVNINWRYSFTKRIFFTGLFVYHTGRPISLPSLGYLVDGAPVTDFSERNNDRVADYHRLDIAFVIEGSPRKKKYWEGHWIVSVYNVYGRKNPYSVFFADSGGSTLMPYQLSLIGTAVPSLTYSFKF
jgi:hypothetical protein